MPLKIHILAHDGSPLEVTEKSIHGEDGRLGIGGAEIAILTLCRGWHEAGHDVTLYNNPNNANGSVFKQATIDSFNPQENRDILIIFRSPSERAKKAKGKRIWLSCDQMTVGDFAAFAKHVDKIVTISPYHAEYFQNTYGIGDSVSIDLPVRTWEYEQDIPKVKNRCVFTSIPDRGVMQLHAAWPRIVRDVPDASLVITSDWRLWNPQLPEDVIAPFRLSYARQKNVTYLGAVKRSRLIEEQLKAELLLYPATYEELFCIAAAEAQVAGAYPITSNYGALRTTNMGTVISGSPLDPKWVDQFVDAAVFALTNKNQVMDEIRKYNQQQAKERFSLEKILKEWDKIFNG